MSTSATDHYWDYLSAHQRDLVREGSYIYQEIFADGKYGFQDYSFVVFPFAKAYEGFVKQLLLDIHAISYQQYQSDHIRIGKLLSPETLHFSYQDSVYEKVAQTLGEIAAERLWQTWKDCRNQVFHYYPHNSKQLSLNEARERIHMILTTMKSCHQALSHYQHRMKPRLGYQGGPRASSL